MRLLSRVVIGIAGVLAIVFGLMRIFGSGIPDCDNSDIGDTVRDLVLQLSGADVVAKADDAAKAKLKDEVKLSDIAETSWDKGTKNRACKATVNLSADGKPVFENMHIAYTLAPTDSRDTVSVQVKIVP